MVVNLRRASKVTVTQIAGPERSGCLKSSVTVFLARTAWFLGRLVVKGFLWLSLLLPGARRGLGGEKPPPRARPAKAAYCGARRLFSITRNCRWMSRSS